MKKILSLLVVLIIGSLAAHADGPTIEAAIAVDKDTKPTDSFTNDVPQLYAFFRSTGTKKGDVLRGVWIADDVGAAAPANTKIDEASITADQDDYYGAFSLTKPTAGWPVGSYHVDIYLGDTLATTAKFTITAAEPADAPAKTE
jgi:hypothetical protein